MEEFGGLLLVFCWDQGLKGSEVALEGEGGRGAREFAYVMSYRFSSNDFHMLHFRMT